MREKKPQAGTAVIAGRAEPDTPDIAGGRLIPADRLKTAIWVFDIDHSRVLVANAAACDLWQAKTEEELCQRDFSKDMSASVSNRLKQYQRDFADRDAEFSEMWTLYPGGKPTSVLVILRGCPLADGRIAMQCEVVGVADDEPDNLRSAEALLHTDVMVVLYAQIGQPLYMNPAARNAATHAEQTISEKFVSPDDFDLMLSHVEQSGEHRLVAHVNTGTGPRWHDITIKKCSDAATGKPAILMTAIDVSELKIARDKARYLADRDQLTGCYNRTYLQHHMALLAQYQTGRCALLCFDVDRFKQINDKLGHEMGDIVLKEIASRAIRAIRRNDIIVRHGGDEFVIVFENVPSAAHFTAKIDALLAEIAKPIIHDATRVNVSVSMGVSIFTPGTVEFTAVMREADIALYASKQDGRNRATFFTAEMGVQANTRDLVETELKHAVENREFVLHFQPRLNLLTGRVVSVEGLVRWQHPQRGLIMPGEFITICEETGMIEDLGHLVLELGCTQAIESQQSGLEIELSLNISPRQFDDARLLKTLERFSQHPDFPYGRIELEITENVLIGDHDLIKKKLAAIFRMGYRIAIDDFGTGYSNLSYISRFPLNCLKIDQSFIAQLPKSGPIISLVLTLGKQIGARVVAEGVETRAQLDWLCAQRCDEVQGYYLSRPIPVDHLRATISELNAKMSFLGTRKRPQH